MNPKGDAIHGGLRELIVHWSAAAVEIDWKHHAKGEDRRAKEEDAADALEEELGGVGAAVTGDLAAGGVPHGEKLGGDGAGPRHAAVVAAELHEEEDKHAGERAHGGDVEQVLDVAVPRGLDVSAAAYGGRAAEERGLDWW